MRCYFCGSQFTCSKLFSKEKGCDSLSSNCLCLNCSVKIYILSEFSLNEIIERCKICFENLNEKEIITLYVYSKMKKRGKKI